MLFSSLLIFGGLILLFFGGEGLVKGASSLALRLGLTPLVVGLTVVAFGTSAPELVVSLKANLSGLGDVAIGNVVGSNIFNIGMILGITALIYPIKVQLQILRWDAPLMLGISGVLVFFLWDRRISQLEGGLLFAGILAYTVSAVVMAKKETLSAEVTAEFSESVVPPKHSSWLDALYIAGGLVLLILGSRWLVEGATAIAKSFGVSDAIIGLTIVSAGTSMPELSACLVAAFRKQPDIAIGNIIGSNIFNSLAIVGISGLVKPISSPGIGFVDMGVMVVFSACLLPLMWSGFCLRRWEGGVLMLGYVGYIVWLWPK